MTKKKFIQKRRSIYYLLAVLLFTGLLMSGCKKDDDTGEDKGNNGDGVRVKEWTYFDNGEFNARVFLIYAGQKLTAVNYYDTQDAAGDIIRKRTVEYDGNKSIIIDYLTAPNGNFEISEKMEIIFDGANMIEYRLYGYQGAEFFLTCRETFIYENDLLVESYMGSGENPSIKWVYTYANDRMVKSERYNYNEYNNTYTLYERTIFEFIDDKMYLVSSQIFTGTVWKNYSKTEYLYQDNLILGKYYEYVNDNWEFKNERGYTIDDNGNIIKQSFSDWTGYMMEIRYYYEAGIGNAHLLMIAPPPMVFKSGFHLYKRINVELSI